MNNKDDITIMIEGLEKTNNNKGLQNLVKEYEEVLMGRKLDKTTTQIIDEFKRITDNILLKK